MALNIKTRVQAPAKREEHFHFQNGFLLLESNENDIYINRVIATTAETRTRAVFRSGPISLPIEKLVLNTTTLFYEVKRLSLQGRTVHIRGSEHDGKRELLARAE